jgi:hypothetical protein
MHRIGSKAAGVAALVMWGAHSAWGATDFSAPKVPHPNLTRGLLKTVTRGGASLDRLSPDLRRLYQQVTHPKRAPLYSPRQLSASFGVDHADTVTPITVLVTVAEGTDNSVLNAAGAAVLRRSENLACARVAIGSLRRLANAEGVVAVRAVKASKIGPGNLEARRPRFHPHIPTRGGSSDFDFDHAGLTGKGVIVGSSTRESIGSTTIFGMPTAPRALSRCGT